MRIFRDYSAYQMDRSGSLTELVPIYFLQTAQFARKSSLNQCRKYRSVLVFEHNSTGQRLQIGHESDRTDTLNALKAIITRDHVSARFRVQVCTEVLAPGGCGAQIPRLSQKRRCRAQFQPVHVYINPHSASPRSFKSQMWSVGSQGI